MHESTNTKKIEEKIESHKKGISLYKRNEEKKNQLTKNSASHYFCKWSTQATSKTFSTRISTIGKLLTTFVGIG